MFLVYLLTSVAPLLFFFSTILISIEGYFQMDREKKLLNSANIIAGSGAIANFFGDMANDGYRLAMDADIDTKSREGGFRVLVFDIKGMVISDSNAADIGRTLIATEMINALEKKNAISLHKEEKSVYASASINNKDSVAGAVLLVASIEDVYTAVSAIQQTLIMYTLITILIMGVLVFVSSQFLIDPLQNIAQVVQKMSEGRLNQRIPISSHDEYARLAQAFNEMAEKLEKVEKTRQEFVSNVSHELKTPLSSMKVLSESILLQEEAPEEVYREFLHDIRSEVDRMTQIVNELLQLVKMDQHSLALQIQPVNINQMLREIMKRLTPLAEQKNISLTFEEIRDALIDADEMKLSLAISNLVDNAIKYTPDGGAVKVIVDTDHQNAFITVQDTGIGIREEDQGKVFDRFYRVDKMRDRETGGTGLGLSITHAAILLHNGSIRLTSKEQEGSTFIVRVPIHYSAA
ncbi:MAG: cell wall metabolism sensor histidine kinase WalK [Clostridiales bacterium]|nr:cell wall metabolism sensor histidine kinase WalK [Clostridiales bacterium]